jgi:imidazoleglycerol-phosphate dehydratase
MAAMARSAEIQRKTGETEVRVTLELDGSGGGERSTGVGFLDHMLDLLARHGRLDLTVRASGDLQTGPHHTVEDVGICIGQALDGALADRSGISRYGDAVVPMDESRSACAIDISGRATNAKLTLHLSIEAGTNAHHMIESAFKAFARALRFAIAPDATEPGIPSTKGLLV